MKIDRPELVDHALVAAFHAKDLEAAVELYEPDAATWTLPHEGGRRIVGRDAIRDAFRRGLFAIDGKMELTVRHLTQTSTVALMRSNWSVTGTLPNGAPVRLAHAGIEIVRRQADGQWKFVIDHPWGCNPIAFDQFQSPPLPEEL